MWAYLASRGTATSRSEIKERGLYGLSGDKPGNGEYFAYSFGKQGVEWNFPVLVLTAYGDNTPAYLFSLITSDGISYSPSEYIGLATKDDLATKIVSSGSVLDLPGGKYYCTNSVSGFPSAGFFYVEVSEWANEKAISALELDSTMKRYANSYLRQNWVGWQEV